MPVMVDRARNSSIEGGCSMRSALRMACSIGVLLAIATQAALAAPDCVPDEALVQYVPGTSDASKASARARAHAAKVEDVADDLELVRVPPGLLDVADAVARLHGDASVDF